MSRTEIVAAALAEETPSSRGAHPPLLRRWMPELDTLRGIAILLVVLFHGYAGATGRSTIQRLFLLFTQGGWAGVNLFFVLSGFLITGILLDSKPSAHFYRNFYIRRALRILPAYYLLLLILPLLPKLGWVGQRQVSLSFVALSFVYLSNMTNLFGVPMQYGPLWSLAVEEQFYLLWPTVVRNFSERVLLFSATTVVFLSPAVRALACYAGFDCGQPYIWYVADGLASGAVLALLARSVLASRARMLYFSGGCLAVGILMIAVGYPFGILFARTLCGMSLRVTALNFIFASVLGTTLVLGTSRWKFIVLRPFLRFLGDISYGLYLIHMLAFEVADHFLAQIPGLRAVVVSSAFWDSSIRFAIGTAFAVLLATASRRYFEEPFLRLKTLLAPV